VTRIEGGREGGREEEEEEEEAMNEALGSRRILYLGFNQDHSCLAVGTRDGYKIFNCDTCSCCYERCKSLWPYLVFVCPPFSLMSHR
jgi:hypothetical protein